MKKMESDEIESYRKKMKEELRDPYVYEGTNVLINKFNIKSNKELSIVETAISKNKLSTIEKVDLSKESKSYVKDIHKHLFEDIYPFAGEYRTVQIDKAEKELGGDSFRYTEPHNISKEVEKVCKFYNKLQTSRFKDDKMKAVGKFASTIWAIHPFREGNTRVAMCVATNYARSIGLIFSATPIKENPKEFRDALLLNSLGEYSEPEKLRDIIKKCVEAGEEKNLAKEENVTSKKRFKQTKLCTKEK